MSVEVDLEYIYDELKSLDKQIDNFLSRHEVIIEWVEEGQKNRETIYSAFIPTVGSTLVLNRSKYSVPNYIYYELYLEVTNVIYKQAGFNSSFFEPVLSCKVTQTIKT